MSERERERKKAKERRSEARERRDSDSARDISGRVRERASWPEKFATSIKLTLGG